MNDDIAARTIGYFIGAGLVFGVPIALIWWRFPSRANRTRIETSRRYLVRHWRGELGLGKSYWLNGLSATLVMALARAGSNSIEITRHPAAYLVGSASLTILGIIASVWLAVGIWRSAGRAQITFWGIAARVIVVFSLLSLIGNTIQDGLPSTYESLRIAFRVDDVPPHKLRILNGGKEIELAGGIDFGTAGALLTLLNATPMATTIDLDNMGGRVAEADRVRDIIRERHLATYTATTCASACTIAFLGGSPRYLGPHGKLAFHRSYFPGWRPEQEAAMIHQEEAAMITAGISPEFAAKAASFPANDLWQPDIPTLLAAHVVTEITDGLSFSATAGLTRVYTTDEADRDLGGISSFASLKRWEPTVYSAILSSMVEGIRQGRSIQDLIAETRGALAGVVFKYKPFAGDDVQVMTARLTSDEAIMLAPDHPAECVEMLNGRGSSTYTKQLTQELRSREIDVTSAIIESGAGQPNTLHMTRTAGEAQITRIWTGVHAISPKLDLTALGKVPTNITDQRSYCLAMAAFMADVTALPPQQAGSFMRFLWRSSD